MKCSLCGGYFTARYNSTQSCCSRLYKNTVTTCYEYASRSTYIEKKFEHPIYQAYIKLYNRLYGRIRRGTVNDNDESLRNALKALRDEYSEKYDHATKAQQEAVIEEFKKQAESILST